MKTYPLPAALEVCVHVPVCLAKCAAHMCREGEEHDVSHSSIAPLQAPSAAPFYFALNGLSKDPLSRAAESFLHFKERKKMVGTILGQYLECEEMLSRGLWPEFVSDTCKFALCSPSPHRRLIIDSTALPRLFNPKHTPSHPISCNLASDFPKLHQEGTEPGHHESEV